jgi:hypothetical protein
MSVRCRLHSLASGYVNNNKGHVAMAALKRSPNRSQIGALFRLQMFPVQV